MSAFAATLRIAGRDALRAKGRSVLVCAMIGLPVGTIVALAVLAYVPSNHDGSFAGDPSDVAISVLAVGMLVLEVVLLAGPAFAVGLRRQRRDLALVAAAGGSPRHLRAIVRAGGLMLGAGSAVVGGGVGIGAAAVVYPIVKAHHSGVVRMHPLAVPWPVVVATVLMGAFSGLVAAQVPARQAARLDVTAALAVRRGQVRERSGWPVLGALAVCLGVAVTVAGLKRNFGFGVFGFAATTAVTGAVLIVFGLVAATPAIVGLVGRAAGRLPVPWRLAVRDAARNRGRTAPAVAAVMAAVTAMTVLGIAAASDAAQERHDYRPAYAMGAGRIDFEGIGHKHRKSMLAAIQRVIPPNAIGRMSITTCTHRGCPHARLLGRGCSPGYCGNRDVAYQALPGGPRVLGRDIMHQVLVGGPRVLGFVQGRDDPAAYAALRSGKAVVFSGASIRRGAVTFRIKRRGRPARDVRVPAIRARSTVRPKFVNAEVVLSPRTARRTGISVSRDGYVVDPGRHRVTQADVDRIHRTLIKKFHANVPLYAETGDHFDSATWVLWQLAAAGTIFVVGGSLIASRLAAADSRSDLAILAAVGAGPRTRRLLAAGQAGIVGLAGAVLGVPAGLVPGIAMAWILTAQDGRWGRDDRFVSPHGPIIVIPWLLLVGICIGVPLLVSTVSGLLTRTRLSTTRRLDT